MFLQLNNRRQHESGMVLLTVMMVVAVIMVLSITLLSQTITKNTSVQAQVDQIRAEQFAKGVFWDAYSAGNFTPGATALGNYNGKAYTATISNPGNNSYSVQVSY